MIQDKNLTSELEGLIKELGPTLEIIQKMKIVEGKVNAGEIGEVVGKAKIKVVQEAKEIKEKGEMTGPKIKKIG
jgi:hypothetical protein